VDIRAIAHITGGGIAGNLVRVLPDHLNAVVHRRAWEAPRVFGEIQRLGGVDDAEMPRVFNLGVGMVLVVPRSDLFGALDVLRERGHRPIELGEIVAGRGDVEITD